MPGKTPSLPSLPANLLLRLAEKADGRRGVPQTIVRVGKGKRRRYDVLTQAEIAARRDAGDTVEELLPIESKHRRSARAKREKETVVTLKVPGAKPRTWTAAEVDALFLTEAAVEKFVLPYYARTLPRADYDSLVTRYYDGEEIAWALVHYPPSFYDVIAGD